jgi:hypothetical protein
MSKLRNFDWRTESTLLIDTQDKQLWTTQNATSFSNWLTQRAEKEGIKRSLLWRYLRVGRYAVELQTGEWQTISSPTDIPDGINADSIELLEKINRVATDINFEILATNLYHKKIKRPQLLKTWQVYSDALPKGQTARGRGAIRPLLDEKNESKLKLAFRQNTLKQLTALSPVSLGYSDSELSLRMISSFGERKKNYGYEGILIASTIEAVIDATLVAFGDDEKSIEHLLNTFSRERLWLIIEAQPQSDCSNTSQSHVPSTYSDSWGIIQVTDNALQIKKTVPPLATPLPFSISELLLDLAH